MWIKRRTRDDAGGGDRGTPRIKRLVHVAPFWARWSDLEKACGAQQDLLARLSTPSVTGQAYFIHDHCREAEDRQLADKLAAAGADVEHLYPVWHWLIEKVGRGKVPWVNASDAYAHDKACNVVREGLEECQKLAPVTPDRVELLVDQLNLFRVRYFFDHTRFDEFLSDVTAPEVPDLGCEDGQLPLPYFVCIDVRFDITNDAHWTFATLSLWSDWPQHDDISPPSREDPTSLDLPVAGEELAALQARFDAVTRRFEWFLHGPDVVDGPPPGPSSRHLRWSRPRLEVFDVGYRSPRFWFAVAGDRPASPLTYLGGDERYEPLVGALADSFLQVADPRADTVATAQLQGEYLVQRRFIHDHHGTASVGDQPTYLLLPGNGSTPAAQEETGYRIVRSLLELEWYAATVLYDVDSDLEVARNHATMYDRTARQAAMLLDALVLHLPGTGGDELQVVHGSIELVHQTLLQGVADLAGTATTIQESVRKVGDGAEVLVARFDRALAQVPVDRHLDIRGALADRGLFARLRERARDDMALAERVQTRYDSLLQEITMAFEERRVRESDKLERYSQYLALLFGVVGVVTALEALVEFRAHARGPAQWVIGIGVGVVAAFLMGVIVWSMGWFRRIGTLGTENFRRRYKDTWSFLAMTSTDSLDALKAFIEGHDDLEVQRRLWNEADERFSEDLARLWDHEPEPPDERSGWLRWRPSLPWLPWRRSELPPLPPASSEPAFTDFLPEGNLDKALEVQRLAQRVEAFVCETLLVSERTPHLSDFVLPRLTCMYRLLSTTRDKPHTNPDTKLVSDFDVRSALVTAGIPEERWRAFLEWERVLLAAESQAAQLDPDHNDATTTSGPPATLPARELLSRLQATGLQHGLTPTAALAVVDHMWTNIRDWRPSACQ